MWLVWKKTNIKRSIYVHVLSSEEEIITYEREQKKKKKKSFKIWQVKTFFKIIKKNVIHKETVRRLIWGNLQAGSFKSLSL
jgi:hypothetical protein